MRRKGASIEPDGLIDIVRQLRQLASDFDAHTFVLEGSFEPYGPEVEEAARVARPAARGAASALFALLTAIERRR